MPVIDICAREKLPSSGGKQWEMVALMRVRRTIWETLGTVSSISSGASAFFVRDTVVLQLGIGIQ